MKWTLTHMSEGGGGSVVLLGLLPHQVDRGRFADASLVVKLVHVGHRWIRRRGWYVAPEERDTYSVWWLIKSDFIFRFWIIWVVFLLRTYGLCKSCCVCCLYESNSGCGTSSTSSKLSLIFISSSKFSRPRTFTQITCVYVHLYNNRFPTSYICSYGNIINVFFSVPPLPRV